MYAEAVSTTMATEIGEPSITQATPEHLAVWGRLVTGASRAAALNNRPDKADELLSHAHSAAVRMRGGRNMDYGKYWAVFSPATIAITKTVNAFVGGDAALTLRIGKGIQRTGNLYLDEWTRHLLVIAEAQMSTRDRAGAIETMKDIRRLAPEWIKNHRAAHDVVLRLLDGVSVRRARSSGLAELAQFMGVEI